jgi:hypothetical protein
MALPGVMVLRRPRMQRFQSVIYDDVLPFVILGPKGERSEPEATRGSMP